MQFVVVEKFTSAYLSQIAREKSCDYLLIIFMKKLRESNMHMRNSGRKIIYSNSANIIMPSVKTRSSNIQVSHVLKAFKPKNLAIQFNELSQ